jgi:hypothetical protein
LKALGRRNRKCINETGEKIVLSIRRLRCQQCRKIHHELPDILIPYKRYDCNSIEAVIVNGKEATVAADESTLARWQNWFNQQALYLMGCLESIAIRFGNQSVKEPIRLSSSSLHRIWQYVGDAPGWLARIVRSVTNLNLWVHTRSAFLSRDRRCKLMLGSWKKE